ncbi:hypothetical protein [Brucella intermedia]|uniref:hypothetical protein n=1 Tax=Brucella intermedia TaxID=94625 RepID=UPI003B63C59E
MRAGPSFPASDEAPIRYLQDALIEGEESSLTQTLDRESFLRTRRQSMRFDGSQLTPLPKIAPAPRSASAREYWQLLRAV